MTRKHWIAAVLALLVSGAAQAAGEMLHKECAACHKLDGAAVQTLKEAFAKKGADLSYAGNKYREEWLVSWLQKPTRIRPAGMYYADHVKRGPKSDEVDPATLQDHVAISKEDATAIAAELMKLRPHDDLIAKEKIEPGTIDRQMGEMTFDKFWGCMACHEIEPGYGGLSGPEVYTAGQRLQPEFIASFIRNPQAWEPKTWMPNKNVSEGAIQKLVRYLELLAKENGNGQ
ncbi:MAG: c-type cytochrome [Gallionellaceae bacterium]|jgi:mono/diheme cytochrome c family protein|nr:c-type cytochrome [Gallionellaceae bacterium]